MLADRRCLAAELEIVLADLYRQARNLGAFAVGESDLQHAAAGIKLRIVEQVTRLRDRRERNIDAVEQCAELSERVLRDDRADDRAQYRAGADSVLIRLIGRIVQQLRPIEFFTEAAPLPIAGEADEN